jgi:transposase InsO family protein
VVDDYSRYAWVFFLEDKGETFGFVRDLVLRLRNERHGDAIRAIRSDNGSEFRNSRFKTFFHDLGLEHQFSSPYRPPQNGVVERKNRTLCEMARTMLDEHRTPKRYWAEAVNTSCYVSNRIYLIVHKKKTCYELMHNGIPKVSHFHVFGCKCFILKKGNNLDKFEARSVDGIFFAYASHSRACRVLNLETNKSWRLAR